jgi:hypothetical protein
MKMSVRTSFSSGRPRASAFTRGRDFTRGRGSVSARTRVPVGVDPRTRPRGPVTARTRSRVRAGVSAFCPPLLKRIDKNAHNGF